MRPQVATVPTLIAGNVAQISVKAGDQVFGGQLLATIENPTLSYQASGSQADYNSAVANVTAARVQERNAGVGYRATVDTTRSQLEDARRIYLADKSLFENKAIPRNQVTKTKPSSIRHKWLSIKPNNKSNWVRSRGSTVTASPTRKPPRASRRF